MIHVRFYIKYLWLWCYKIRNVLDIDQIIRMKSSFDQWQQKTTIATSQWSTSFLEAEVGLNREIVEVFFFLNSSSSPFHSVLERHFGRLLGLDWRVARAVFVLVFYFFSRKIIWLWFVQESMSTVSLIQLKPLFSFQRLTWKFETLLLILWVPIVLNGN